MSYISYAQNFEDVILLRALKDVKQGFYIDVGAHDPVIDSVTKAFYDKGWKGINVEPVQEWYDKLEESRPNDINLQIAVAANSGELDFYEVPGTGLSTLNKSIALEHAEKSGFSIKNYKIPTLTLTAICELHSKENIHFLKIDVEGAEQEVLESLNFKTIRPWIIIVESTMPCTEIESHQSWESGLLKEDYDFVWFDGLNRFYIAKEHLELKTRLAIPPNLFDNFTLSGAGNSPLHKQIEQIQISLTHSTNSHKEAAKSLEAIHNSTCWRITWPLRKLIEFFKGDSLAS